MFTLHRECCRGLWLTLALALFMIWPSITLRNLNSLLQPYTFCLKPALKCCKAVLDYTQLCVRHIAAAASDVFKLNKHVP